MSHYTTVELEIKDIDVFVESLCEVWPKKLTRDMIEVHKEPQHLYGYMGDQREQKANVIIRRKNVGRAANDIGFLIENGKCTAYISEYDHKMGYGQKWQNKLRQTYATNLVTKQAKQRGWRVEKKVVDGKIKLTVTR